MSRRAAFVLAACALLAACATDGTAPKDATDGAATQAPAPPRTGSASPVFGPETPHAATQAPVSSAPRAPLDATRLPPFDGSSVTVRETLRPAAGLDHTVPADDLWHRIRRGFAMPNLENAQVQSRMAWYGARPEYLKRTLERARRYLYHIVDEIEKRGLPTELALLPMVESSFNPMAYSRAHASGLWQFIPGTGKRYDLAQNWWYDGRRDILASTAAALDYLRDVYEMHGDWHLALASYNWGENAVARALEKNRAAGLPLDYASLTMPTETREYVPKLQALKNIIANPAPFGFTLDAIPNQPYFATVTGVPDLDVQLAARLAEMPVEEIIALNPGFNRPLMPASVNARLVLPAEKVEVFHRNLLKHDGAIPVAWQTYRPAKGESLATIAKRFRVPLDRLMEVNGIGRRSRGTPTMMVVPVNGATVDPRKLPIMYAPPIPASAPGRTYLVRRGDTLWSISQRNGVSVEDLRRWNKIGRIQPGQRLRVSDAAPEKTAAPGSKKRSVKPSKRKNR